MTLISILRKTVPFVVSVLNPEFGAYSAALTNEIIEAEKTGKEGKDKQQQVIDAILPVVTAERGISASNIGDAGTTIKMIIDVAIAIANIIARFRK